ncbi:hypothetical protein [Chitinophaga vietnamensis]|uniref:hypothetical protein n=1 Tax=Chitinophaga vietnamensis TaxID=2593957 RepID=UPI00119D3FE0|nr:hypothetical protein [Chitinophaga vietnamensis]
MERHFQRYMHILSRLFYDWITCRPACRHRHAVYHTIKVLIPGLYCSNKITLYLKITIMKKHFFFIIVVMIAAAAAIVIWKNPAGAIRQQKVYSFPLSSDIPHDLPLSATEADFAEFAWNEFFALNYRSNYNTIKHWRGKPDLNWSYNSAKSPGNYPDLTVWETYNHRVELRPASDSMLPFDKAPVYSYYHPYPIAPGTDTTAFNNLDESSEIGSCNLYAFVSHYQRQYQVLYQAKTNRDEYNYILTYYNKKDSLKNATARTQSNISKLNAYYKGHPSSCNCDPKEKVICLPCGGPGQEGAIEVKTAWRKLTPGEDRRRFFMRRVLTYRNTPEGIRAVNDEYALIGLHIIHKTTNYPDFIIATFEQMDVEYHDMGYALLKNDVETGGIRPYVRDHPILQITKNATDAAHQQLAKVNRNSVWLNYRLVGVQHSPTNDTHSPNFYLANYVIESDSVLQNFRGSSIDSPYNGGENTFINGHKYTMGGCQGCHGAAQLRLGTDLSFLLDNVGKPVDKPDVGSTSTKFRLYQEAFRRISAVDK